MLHTYKLAPPSLPPLTSSPSSPNPTPLYILLPSSSFTVRGFPFILFLLLLILQIPLRVPRFSPVIAAIFRPQLCVFVAAFSPRETPPFFSPINSTLYSTAAPGSLCNGAKHVTRPHTQVVGVCSLSSRSAGATTLPFISNPNGRGEWEKGKKEKRRDR